MKLLLIPIFTTLATVASASITYTTVDLLPFLNSDLDGDGPPNQWSSGTDYQPLFPSSTTLGGVPFALQEDPQTGFDIIYPTFGSGEPVDTMADTTIIPVGVFGVSQVHTLINSAWGTAGVLMGQLHFIGSGGALHILDLIGGVNVRDHYFDTTFHVNTTSDPNTQEVFRSANNVGLDMQTTTLPAEFQTQTLSSIEFVSYGLGRNGGSPFLAGATVATPMQTPSTPVPDGGTSLILLGAGIGGLALGKRLSVDEK